MVQFDLGFQNAIEIYTLLTIGDGLVSQLPALISSTATGIIITRATKSDDGKNTITVNGEFERSEEEMQDGKGLLGQFFKINLSTCIIQARVYPLGRQ